MNLLSWLLWAHLFTVMGIVVSLIIGFVIVKRYGSPDLDELPPEQRRVAILTILGVFWIILVYSLWWIQR